MEVPTMALTAMLVGACFSAWLLASRLSAIMSELQKLHSALRENDRELQSTIVPLVTDKTVEVEPASDE